MDENLYTSSLSSKPNEAQELFIDVKKILLATDGSKAAINATKHAVGWAKFFEAKVRAIFVNSSNDTGDYEPKSLEDHLRNGSNGSRGLEGLRVAKQYAESNNVACEELVLTGNVARGIIEDAEQFLPDLIIIGNSEKSGIRRSLGSIVDAVMKGTDIPVLVVNNS